MGLSMSNVPEQTRQKYQRRISKTAQEKNLFIVDLQPRQDDRSKKMPQTSKNRIQYPENIQDFYNVPQRQSNKIEKYRNNTLEIHQSRAMKIKKLKRP